MTDPVGDTVIPALPSVQDSGLRCTAEAFCCFPASLMEIFSFLFEVFSSLFSCFKSMIPKPVLLWNPRDPSLTGPHASVQPPSLGQENRCQSAVCSSCRRSITYWFRSLGQSIFMSNLLSSRGYLKLKWTPGGINIIWKGERDFWQLALGCGAADEGSVSSVFPVVNWVWVMMSPVLTPCGELSIHHWDHLLADVSRPH